LDATYAVAYGMPTANGAPRGLPPHHGGAEVERLQDGQQLVLLVERDEALPVDEIVRGHTVR